MAEITQRLNAAALSLMDKLEQAIEELDCGTQTQKEKEKTEAGEVLREVTRRIPGEKTVVDRSGMKQLTSILKDLQDVLLFDPDMEQQERQMKLQRLERELNPAEDSGVTVILEGEIGDYAG